MGIDARRIAETLTDFRKDHRKLLRRVEELERILGEILEEQAELSLGTEKALRELGDFFQGEFLRHCREEEVVLYPLLRPFVGSGTCILDLVGQHTALREDVEKFTRAVGLGTGEPAKMIPGEILDHGLHLSTLACGHIRHEESVLFDLAERLLPGGIARCGLPIGGRTVAYRILVVDDDADDREGLRRILSREGYKVDPAIDGLDALEKAARLDYDLVLTDLLMPRLDGLSLLERLRGAKPHLPVLLITGFGDWGSYARAIEMGAAAYLCKPFRINELLDGVRKALGEKTERAISGAPI
jgi:CheY-like chemotaxis protein/hemerythrin-like domain-containing protein